MGEEKASLRTDVGVGPEVVSLLWSCESRGRIHIETKSDYASNLISIIRSSVRVNSGFGSERVLLSIEFSGAWLFKLGRALFGSWSIRCIAVLLSESRRRNDETGE